MRVLPRSCLKEAGAHVLFYAACYLGMIAAVVATPLLKQGAPPEAVAVFLGDQLLLLSLLALPLAFVTGLLTTIGRMREDGEITALMAAGVSTWAICRTFLPLAVVLAMWLGFACHVLLPDASRRLMEGRSELLRQALITQVRRRAPILQDDGAVVAAIGVEDDRLKQLFAIQTFKDGQLLVCYAPEARWTAEPKLVDGSTDPGRSAALSLELRNALLLHHEAITPGQPPRCTTGILPSYTVAIPGRATDYSTSSDAMSTLALWHALGETPDDAAHRERLRDLERSWHIRWLVPVAVMGYWAFACGLALALGRGSRLLSVFLGLVTVIATLVPGFGIAKSLEGSLTINAGWLLWPPVLVTSLSGCWMLWKQR